MSNGGRDEEELSSASASVESASAMKPSATVKPATEARVSSGGVGPCDATVVKTAERTGVRTWLAVWRREAMLRAGESSRGWAAMNIASVTSEIAAIDECSAVGNV